MMKHAEPKGHRAGKPSASSHTDRFKRLRGVARRAAGHGARWLWYGAAVVFALLAVLFSAARVMLPMVAEKRAELETYLSEVSTHQVRIDDIQPYWDGLHPGFKFHGLRIYPLDSVQPAAQLNEVRVSIALLPLLLGRVEINNHVIVQPRLALERLADGHFRVSGFRPASVEGGQANEKFIGWIFKHGTLMIEDGEVQWFDHRDSGSALNLEHVNLTLKNDGNRHKLRVEAKFPPGMCGSCVFVVDAKGNPFHDEDWSARTYVQAEKLKPHALPKIVRELFPGEVQGTFDAELWSEWAHQRPLEVTGHFAVDALKLSVASVNRTVSVRRAKADVSWEALGDGWRLDLANFDLGLTGPSWSVDRLRLVHRARASTLQVKHINLDDISASARDLRETHALARLLGELNPGGSLDQLKLQVRGPWSEPEEFSINASFENLRAAAYERFPGFQGLSGQISGRSESGEVEFTSNDFSIELPRVFRAPLTAARASGRLSWKKATDGWEVGADKLSIAGPDGTADGKMLLRIPPNGESAPHLKLRIDFRDGNGAHAARYYPEKKLSERTLAWMESSFLGGTITSGYLIYDGRIDQYPFDAGVGRFELHGHVRDGVYQYLRGWEPVRDAEVDVAIKGRRVIVTGSGKIGNLEVTRAVVNTTRDEQSGANIVRVSAKVHGAAAETLRVLRDVDSRQAQAAWKGYVPAQLRAQGDGTLSLDLTIPTRTPEAFRMAGEYRFLQNTFESGSTALTANGVSGIVRFSESGLEEGTLTAKVFGGGSVIGVDRGPDRELILSANGSIPAVELTRVIGARMSEHVSGNIDWDARWRSGPGKPDFHAEFDATKVRTRLPSPLDADRTLAAAKLVLQTESVTPERHILTVSDGNDVNGQLAFGIENDAWQFTNGHIGLGEKDVRLSVEHGMHLSARLDDVDIDAWQELTRGGKRGDIPRIVSRVSAYAQSVRIFDRRFSKVAIDFQRRKSSWRGYVNSAAASGSLRYDPGPPVDRWVINFERLVWPASARKDEDTGAARDPRSFPELSARIRSFHWKDRELGELNLTTERAARGIQISKLTLTRPEMRLTVTGGWKYVSGRHSTNLDLAFNSDNLGETLAAWGMPEQVEGGNVELKSNLSWPGAPASVGFERLNGHVDVVSKKGRFLRVKQGAGRLFGIFDFSSIFGYLMLDFSPLFGKGYPYDQLKANLTLERGSAYTRNLTLKGPTANMQIDGRVGIASEDFDLVLAVEPQLSGGLTLATWGIFGPQVAAVILALQKIFKKQIAAGTRVLYVVKGSWNKPDIKRLAGEGGNAQGTAPAEEGRKSRDD